MRNLEASPYLEDPRLIEIKAVTERNQRLSEFNLAVSLTRTTEDPAAAKKPGAKPAAKPGVGANDVTPARPAAGGKLAGLQPGPFLSQTP
jgi:hypothetical protein